jgi:N-acetylmuramoyl-L-alanine amidase
MIYIIDHIPKTTPHNRRPAYSMTPTTITIHNTGNPTSTARNERAWLTSPSNDRTASYHIAVDEREAIECLPLNENAWHSGDGSGVKSGNRTSIGVEICESGNYAKTLDNAAQLVAGMLKERGWGTDRLRRHFDWSGKICPRLMYDGGKWTGWSVFVASVGAKLTELNKPKVTEPVTVKPRDITVTDTQITDERNGKIYAAILCDGVTYAPVRDIAEASGRIIGLDGKNVILRN